MSGKLLVVSIVIFFLLFFIYESWLMRSLPHWRTVEKQARSGRGTSNVDRTCRSVLLLVFLACGGGWKLAIKPSWKDINSYKHRCIDDPHIVQFIATIIYKHQGCIAQNDVNRHSAQHRKFAEHLLSKWPPTLSIVLRSIWYFETASETGLSQTNALQRSRSAKTTPSEWQPQGDLKQASS